MGGLGSGCEPCSPSIIGGRRPGGAGEGKRMVVSIFFNAHAEVRNTER